MYAHYTKDYKARSNSYDTSIIHTCALTGHIQTKKRFRMQRFIKKKREKKEIQYEIKTNTKGIVMPLIRARQKQGGISSIWKDLSTANTHN